MVALILSKSQCDYIMVHVLDGGLPRAGICKNMPRADLYGDLDHKYMGPHYLNTTMGLQHVQTLLTNIWKENITGKLRRLSHETFKLELGIRGSIIHYNYYNYKHVPTDC